MSYKHVPKVLTEQDKLFIKLTAKGTNRTKAFRLAYPDHPTVQRYMDAVKNGGPDEKEKTRQAVTSRSKDKIRTQHIQNAMTTYNKKMEEFTDHSVDTAIDLVQNARSEKVRADLAIEGMRHRVGTPVQKVQVTEDRNIYIGFGKAHPDDVLDDIIEGEVVQ